MEKKCKYNNSICDKLNTATLICECYKCNPIIFIHCDNEKLVINYQDKSKKILTFDSKLSALKHFQILKYETIKTNKD